MPPQAVKNGTEILTKKIYFTKINENGPFVHSAQNLECGPKRLIDIP